MKRKSDGNNAVRRSRIGTLLNVLCVAVAVFMLYVVVSYNTDDTLFGKTYYVEKTDNMSPSVDKYDVVKTNATQVTDLNVGDTITFYMDTDSDGEREVITRNVYAVALDGDKYIARTIALDSDTADSWYVTDKSLLGEVESVTSFGGKVLIFLKNDNFMVAVIVISALLLAYEIGMLYVINRINYRKDKEERRKSVWNADEKQYIGEINKQPIAARAVTGERRVKVYYSTLPYNDGK